MRRTRVYSPWYLAVVVATSMIAGCRTAPGPHIPDAETIVEGTTAPGVRIDTADLPFGASLEIARWRAREISTAEREFWSDVAVLDIPRAERDAVDMDQRTFTVALRHLMASDPEEAAVAFQILHRTANDPDVRAWSRIGLTMALTWSSDWATIARLEHDPDSLASSPTGVLTRHYTAVESWAHAFANIPPPSIAISGEPIILPLRRSSVGTPIARVLINGRPHEFWLDTGASMTVLSTDIATEAGVHLAANDTLALGVVGGSIDARAVLIDSLSLGGFTARGITAALVSASMLRLDHRMENGHSVPVLIDGVIGADLMRHMDLVIDVAAGTITIRKPRRDRRSVRNLFWVGFPVVRLIARGGRPLLFGLDTGAESTYITARLLEKLPRTHVATRRGQLGGLGGEKEQTEWVARELTVSDGTYAIKLSNTPIGPERDWNFVSFDGVVGSDIALGTRLHLDFENGVFDVRPTRPSQ
ncbi:MAG: retropepsin-like aspartic protease family protein [Gemmatimonadaceae bacterium]